MNTSSSKIILCIGSIYVETNYLELETGGKDELAGGKEYQSASWEMRPAGSAVNVATQLVALGCKVKLIGKRGRDEMGQKLCSLLEGRGVDSSHLVVSKEVQTSVDTGVVFKHNGNNIQLVSGGANGSLCYSDIINQSLDLDNVGAVYLGGMAKQHALITDYPKLISFFNEKGIKVFLDHGRIPVDFSEEKRQLILTSIGLVDGYFPNEEEICAVTKTNRLTEAVGRIMEIGVKLVIVKQGGNGCTVATPNKIVHIPGRKVEVLNTVGAGDAFNAGFISEYQGGKSPEDSARFANATAAKRVGSKKYFIGLNL
ncbi:hypothetical protein COY90_05010 [Candidatus Roizmanbacteria bacterium CG_4_10_14_0_8_um_filter_39_9]|uniref:Carbohydrate kinase PfkB domain-containing protein n=1 Tax=Candidatus Roizmanbacteria bacterium CG_4_10_14_0_8_um_filter_39_9 TaxID=1974829 RepID=A0A2M7QBK3_9BACT|nr:MAG: hypothetical protein COY90_05010 [Candidatus Roizmanbacteria bacterium CG_4_10_14_0_8_um_filter_39_9]